MNFINFIKDNWIACLIAGVILLIVTPIIAPFLKPIMSFLGNGIVWLLKGLLKIIAWPFKKLFGK